MVYLLGVNAVDATGYSLFVVGLTSLIGGLKYIFNDLVDIKTATIFAIPSIISVFLTRKFVAHAIPDPVLRTSTFLLTKDSFILLFFSVLMIIVGITMVGKNKYQEPDVRMFHHYNYPMLIFIGSVSGILTGIVGVGGGFIIIPSLVLFAKIPVKMSVGTSLLIIAANSFIGFAGEIIVRQNAIDYKFLLLFALFSVTGIFIGFRIVSKILPEHLKRLFGWLVLITGVSILANEVFLTI